MQRIWGLSILGVNSWAKCFKSISLRMIMRDMEWLRIVVSALSYGRETNSTKRAAWLSVPWHCFSQFWRLIISFLLCDYRSSFRRKLLRWYRSRVRLSTEYTKRSRTKYSLVWKIIRFGTFMSPRRPNFSFIQKRWRARGNRRVSRGTYSSCSLFIGLSGRHWYWLHTTRRQIPKLGCPSHGQMPDLTNSRYKRSDCSISSLRAPLWSNTERLPSATVIYRRHESQ